MHHGEIGVRCAVEAKRSQQHLGQRVLLAIEYDEGLVQSLERRKPEVTTWSVLHLNDRSMDINLLHPWTVVRQFHQLLERDVSLLEHDLAQIGRALKQLQVVDAQVKVAFDLIALETVHALVWHRVHNGALCLNGREHDGHESR